MPDLQAKIFLCRGSSTNRSQGLVLVRKKIKLNMLSLKSMQLMDRKSSEELCVKLDLDLNVQMIRNGFVTYRGRLTMIA